MKTTRDLTSRIMSLTLFVCAAAALVFAVATWRFRAALFEEHSRGPQTAVEMAMSQVEALARLEAAGTLTRADAQRQALDLLRRSRFEGDNYVWVNDLGPTMVMHPFKPELDGQDLSTMTDPDGKHLFVEFVKVVQASPSGRGTVGYQWPKPGASQPVPKVSYVALFRPWGWVVGAGAYTDNVAAAVSGVVWMAVGLGVGGIVASLLMAWVMSRRLAAPLQVAIRSLRDGAAQVADASQSVAGIAQQLASGATTAAAAVQESNTAMISVSAHTEANARSADAARELAARSRQHAEAAHTSMTATVQEMERLAASGQQVGKIIKTIDEIAFQTNLLALNAAVEAARAGEAGRGFAVVAEEVRHLAQRSAEAAKTTAQLVDATVQGIGSSATSVRQAHDDFQHVAGAVSEVATLVEGISGSSREQVANLGEVGTSLSSIDQSTQQNAASAEEIAAAAEELSGQAESLRSVVVRIHDLIEGAPR